MFHHSTLFWFSALERDTQCTMAAATLPPSVRIREQK